MYWADAQINYKDKIEEQVTYLQEEMRKQDPTATATINGEEINIMYKDQNIKLKYENSNKKEEINYFYYWINENSIIKMYKTENEKIYLEDEKTKVCLNDKYPELNEENKFKITNYGYEGIIFNDKNVWKFINNSVEEFTLTKIIDLKQINGGAYTNQNIKFFLDVLILDNGKMYKLNDNDNSLEEYYVLPQLKDIKNNTFGVIIYENKQNMLFLDNQGKSYLFNLSTGEEITSNYANGFLVDKKIINCTNIKVQSNVRNVFITEDGEMYLLDPQTEEVVFKSSQNEFLKNKKIKTIYYMNENYEERYTEVLTEDGNCYYTEDFETFYDINKNGFPKLTMDNEGQGENK